MKIKSEFALFSEKYVTDQETGSLSVFNIIDVIRTESLPATIHKASVICKLNISEISKKDNSISIDMDLEDPVGKSISPKDKNELIIEVKNDKESNTSGFIVNVEQISLHTEGTYTFKIRANGSVVAEVTFLVEEVKQ